MIGFGQSELDGVARPCQYDYRSTELLILIMWNDTDTPLRISSLFALAQRGYMAMNVAR
jgi:hypothetical protein